MKPVAKFELYLTLCTTFAGAAWLISEGWSPWKVCVVYATLYGAMAAASAARAVWTA